jgi:cell division protein FtsL
MITKKVNKKNLVLSVFAGFFVIFFLTFYIWDQAESVRIGYKTKDLEEEIERLRGDIEQLETQKASLLSLDRVEQMAMQELRMVIPSEKQIIFKKSDEDLRQQNQ